MLCHNLTSQVFCLDQHVLKLVRNSHLFSVVLCCAAEVSLPVSESVELRPNKTCRLELVLVLVITAFSFLLARTNTIVPPQSIQGCPEQQQLSFFLLQRSKKNHNHSKRSYKK